MKVGKNLSKDVLAFLKHKGMEHYEQTIDYTTAIAYSFTQYSLKRGLKEFRSKEELTVTNELSQLHMRYAFYTKSSKHLTYYYKWDALEYLIFLLANIEVRVKVIICVDGSKQRKYLVPGDTTCPTLST